MQKRNFTRVECSECASVKHEDQVFFGDVKNMIISMAKPLKSNAKSLYEIGNALPNWIGGINNSFRYKGFVLTTLIDISQGGKIFSQSLREELIYGTIKKTLPGRDGTYVAEGIVAQKKSDGTWEGSGQVNIKQIKAQDYWNVIAPDKDNVVSEEMVNDASYIMLREMTLNYQLPAKLVRVIL